MNKHSIRWTNFMTYENHLHFSNIYTFLYHFSTILIYFYWNHLNSTMFNIVPSKQNISIIYLDMYISSRFSVFFFLSLLFTIITYLCISASSHLFPCTMIRRKAKFSIIWEFQFMHETPSLHIFFSVAFILFVRFRFLFFKSLQSSIWK